MALAQGFRLGAFQLIDLIGRGGMGEVYLATDTKLKRQVAIKILPRLLVGDHDRLARFQREAEVLASLNHPSIAAIYGLEQSGDLTALVMELVQGDDLSQRIARGPIPLDEALPIAKQIAEALEAAHEQGIVHRDLKPANIKVRADGAVKVLDFGLAKAMETAPRDSPSASMSPTITTPAMTQAGIILGTAAYMSPEQARGTAVDKRADLWALGVVLFEMLTGQQLFEATTVSDTLAFVLTKEPDWTRLPANSPIPIRRLLRRCLDKDRKRRMADAADVRIEIDEAIAALSEAVGDETRPRHVRHIATPLLLAFAMGGVVVGATLWLALRPATVSAPSPVTRTLVAVTPADQLSTGNRNERSYSPYRPSHRAIALSPDARQLVFSAVRGDTVQLYVRALDTLAAEPMAGTDGGSLPFFSPDGKWVGFFAAGELRKAPVAGGPAVTICKFLGGAFGASWGPDNTIVFAGQYGGLFQVSANGGTPRPLTTLDPKEGAVSHRLPQFVPDGKAVIFTIQKSNLRWDNAQIVVRSLATGEQRVLVEGAADGQYVPTGHLIYVRQGTLMAAPFDLGRLAVTGGAVGIIDGVMQAMNAPLASLDSGAAQVSVSNSGTLVYVAGSIFPASESSLVWVDRAGSAESLELPPRRYAFPRLSPDGRRLVVSTAEGADRTLWLHDLLRSTLTRLTTEGQNDRAVWTPDGKRLAFASTTSGPLNLFWKPADASGGADRLGTSLDEQDPASWTPDGKTLVFVVLGRQAMSEDIWTLSLSDRVARPLVNAPAAERWPDLSPDGRWLAYASNETGRFEVYVQPFPGPGVRQQISAQGGAQPAWARNGRELFFTVPIPNSNDGRMWAVDVSTTPTFTAGLPKPLNAVVRVGAVTRGYDVAVDGRRFLTVQANERAPEPPPAQVILVQNWTEELKRLVPTK